MRNRQQASKRSSNQSTIFVSLSLAFLVWRRFLGALWAAQEQELELELAIVEHLTSNRTGSPPASYILLAILHLFLYYSFSGHSFSRSQSINPSNASTSAPSHRATSNTSIHTLAVRQQLNICIGSASHPRRGLCLSCCFRLVLLCCAVLCFAFRCPRKFATAPICTVIASESDGCHPANTDHERLSHQTSCDPEGKAGRKHRLQWECNQEAEEGLEAHHHHRESTAAAARC